MKTIEQLKQENSLEDFVGFKKVKELRNNLNTIPAVPGVYVVLRASEAAPEFLEKGTGGFFQGKDPNVSVATLAAKWVIGESIMYIGKGKNLHKRINELLKFGEGNDIGHRGGRYLWQLADAEELIVAWMPIGNEDAVESYMIDEFIKQCSGQKPFANINRGKKQK